VTKKTRHSAGHVSAYWRPKKVPEFYLQLAKMKGSVMRLSAEENKKSYSELKTQAV
jgi:hypothetical protein